MAVTHYRSLGSRLTACGRRQVAKVAASWQQVSCPSCLLARRR